MTWCAPARTFHGDLMRARHRLSKLLLRHGLVYEASASTAAHDGWLRRQRFESRPLAFAFDECQGAVLQAKARRDAITARLAQVPGFQFSPSAAAPCAHRGADEIATIGSKPACTSVWIAQSKMPQVYAGLPGSLGSLPGAGEPGATVLQGRVKRIAVASAAPPPGRAKRPEAQRDTRSRSASSAAPSSRSSPGAE